MIAYIPNIITSLRIIGTLCLLFTDPFSPNFYIIYTFTGISDVVDGTIARLTGTASEFGAKLDGAADLLFYTTMFFMIVGRLFGMLPGILWVLFVTVILIRVIAYIAAAVRLGEFASTHSPLNKITGFGVFLVPYVMSFQAAIVPFCSVLGLVSLVAALLELKSFAA